MSQTPNHSPGQRSSTTYRPEFITYTTQGLKPIAGIFQLTVNQLRDMIFDIASKSISGVQDVTMQWDRKSKAVAWYIWFNSNDEHFVDRSSEKTALGNAIRRRSKALEDFANKFGYCDADDSNDNNASNKVILNHIFHSNTNNEAGGRRITAMQASINPFLNIIFDVNGSAFKSQFGDNTNPPKCFLRRSWVFDIDTKGNANALLGIAIEKTMKNIFANRHKPVVGKGGRF